MTSSLSILPVTPSSTNTAVMATWPAPTHVPTTSQQPSIFPLWQGTSCSVAVQHTFSSSSTVRKQGRSGNCAAPHPTIFTLCWLQHFPPSIASRAIACSSARAAPLASLRKLGNGDLASLCIRVSLDYVARHSTPLQAQLHYAHCMLFSPSALTTSTNLTSTDAKPRPSSSLAHLLPPLLPPACLQHRTPSIQPACRSLLLTAQQGHSALHHPHR